MEFFEQVGVTPEGVEVPRSLVDQDMQEKLRTMPQEFQPLTPSGPDPKWRYMWRVGPRPSETLFKVLTIWSFDNLQTFWNIRYLIQMISLLGAEFWACYSWGISGMGRNYEFVGVQNDICNRGEILSFTNLDWLRIFIWKVTFTILFLRLLLKWQQLDLACRRMLSLLLWSR